MPQSLLAQLQREFGLVHVVGDIVKDPMSQFTHPDATHYFCQLSLISDKTPSKASP
jgi:hypothetical protein